MKITKKDLKRIIREELTKSLFEVQVGMGEKPPSIRRDVEPAPGGFPLPDDEEEIDMPPAEPLSRGEARRQARARGDLTYTYKGKKYGTRGSAETDVAAFKKKMAAIRAQRAPGVETFTGPETQITGMQDPAGGSGVPAPIGDIGKLDVPKVSSPSKEDFDAQSGIQSKLDTQFAQRRIDAARRKIAARMKQMKAADPFYDPKKDPMIARWKGAIERQQRTAPDQTRPVMPEGKKITSSSLKKLINEILKNGL